MGGKTTVSATIHHLTKLRKRLGDKSHDFPPPCHGGNDRVDLGTGTSTIEKEGDSYDSDGEEAFKVREDFRMAHVKRAKRAVNDDHGDLLKVPASDDSRFVRGNLELWEGDEGSMTSALKLGKYFTKWIIESLIECRQHSEFEPSLTRGFDPPIYNMCQIGGFFEQAPKFRAFDLAPDAACTITSRNIAECYPTLDFERVPSVPETIANSTGKYETPLADHGLFPDDLNIDDPVGDPSFGNKAESQTMIIQPSQELVDPHSATNSITGSPEQRHHQSLAEVQSITTQETTSSNVE